jgi:hypothetical protein
MGFLSEIKKWSLRGLGQAEAETELQFSGLVEVDKISLETLKIIADQTQDILEDNHLDWGKKDFSLLFIVVFCNQLAVGGNLSSQFLNLIMSYIHKNKSSLNADVLNAAMIFVGQKSKKIDGLGSGDIGELNTIKPKERIVTKKDKTTKTIAKKKNVAKKTAITKKAASKKTARRKKGASKLSSKRSTPK